MLQPHLRGGQGGGGSRQLTVWGGGDAGGLVARVRERGSARLQTRARSRIASASCGRSRWPRRRTRGARCRPCSCSSCRIKSWRCRLGSPPSTTGSSRRRPSRRPDGYACAGVAIAARVFPSPHLLPPALGMGSSRPKRPAPKRPHHLPSGWWARGGDWGRFGARRGAPRLGSILPHGHPRATPGQPPGDPRATTVHP